MKLSKALAAVKKKIYEEVGADINFKVLISAQREALSANQVDEYCNNFDHISQEAKAKVDEIAQTIDQVDVADVIDYLGYIVKVIGIDHVGISSDFDGGSGIQGRNDASETFNDTLELVKRGYSEQDNGLRTPAFPLKGLPDCNALNAVSKSNELDMSHLCFLLY